MWNQQWLKIPISWRVAYGVQWQILGPILSKIRATYICSKIDPPPPSDKPKWLLYIHILHIFTKIHLPPTWVTSLMNASTGFKIIIQKTHFILFQADKLGCRSFITPKDVTEGIYKLNLAFVANLFNNHPSLDATNIDLEEYANVEESREERSKHLPIRFRMSVLNYTKNLQSKIKDQFRSPHSDTWCPTI